jgi:hypothetical protein
LFAPPAGRKHGTLLGTYRGTGPLIAWLATIVRRRLGACLHTRVPDSSEVATLPGSLDPVEGVSLDAELCARFVQVLETAWRNLTSREAIAIDLRYRLEIPQRTIAGLLAVTESRISQLIASAEDRMRAAVRRLWLAGDFSGLQWRQLVVALRHFLEQRGQAASSSLHFPPAHSTPSQHDPPA